MTQISIHYTGDIVTKKEAIELSLTRYFTGKPCKNGHIAQRQTKKSTCCECSKIKTREFELKNKGNRKKEKQDYYKNNKDKILKRCKKNQNKNKEKIRNYTKLRYSNNREYVLGIGKKYREKKKVLDPLFSKKNREKSLVYYHENKEKCRDKSKKYFKENPLKNTQYKANRRGRVIGNGGSSTAKQAKDLLEKQKYKCVNCKCCLKNNIKHFDHIIPVKLGGTSDINNMQWLCAKCNTSKHAKHPIDWARENGRLL